MKCAERSCPVWLPDDGRRLCHFDRRTRELRAAAREPSRFARARQVIDEVSAETGVTKTELVSRSHAAWIVASRREAVRRLVELGLSRAAIAPLVGLTRAGVTYHVRASIRSSGTVQ